LNIGFSDFLAVVGVVLAILPLYRERRKKHLSLIYNFIPVANSIIDIIKVSFNDDNKCFKNLSISNVLIINTGLESLSKNNFLYECLSIKTDDQTKITRVKLLDLGCDTRIQPTITNQADHSIDINFEYLASNKYFILEIFFETDSLFYKLHNYNNYQEDNFITHAKSPNFFTDSELINGTIKSHEFILSSIPKYYISLLIMVLLIFSLYASIKICFDVYYQMYLAGSISYDINLAYPFLILMMIWLVQFIYRKHIVGIFSLPRKARKLIKEYYGLR